MSTGQCQCHLSWAGNGCQSGMLQMILRNFLNMILPSDVTAGLTCGGWWILKTLHAYGSHFMFFNTAVENCYI